MTRPVYPSDERRRKTRPHVKVHLSVANHPKTAAAWAKPELRGMLVELWRIAGEKYAGRTNDEIVLTPGDLSCVAGRSQVRHNLVAVSLLCKHVGYTMRTEGSITYVRVRNFAKKQGFDSAPRGATPRSYADSATPPIPTPIPTPKEEKSQRPSDAPRLDEDPKALAFATDFRTALERVHEGIKPPTDSAFRGWVKQSRLLLKEREEAEVRSLAKWLFDTTGVSEGASFWRSNILSVPAFRKRFDQLQARKRQEETHGKRQAASGRSTSDLAERARELVRLRAVGGADGPG